MDRAWRWEGIGNGDGKGMATAWAMAASSTRKNFVIDTEEIAQKFVDAIDWSMAHREPIKSDATAHYTEGEELSEFCKRRTERYGKK